MLVLHHHCVLSALGLVLMLALALSVIVGVSVIVPPHEELLMGLGLVSSVVMGPGIGDGGSVGVGVVHCGPWHLLCHCSTP